MNSEPQCELFGILGIVIQALLGFLSFSTLIIKRYKDPKRRPWLIWGMDTSKQGFGACYLHTINLIFAELLAGHSGGQCKWYFLNYIMDIIIGTFLNYIFLLLIERIFMNIKLLKFDSGVYEDKLGKPCFGKWIYQFMIWIFVLTIAKFCVIGIGFSAKNILNLIGDFLLAPFKINADFELIMIMVILPFIMNAGQFWVQDNFLQKREKPKTKEVEVFGYEKNIKEILIDDEKNEEKNNNRSYSVSTEENSFVKC